MKNVGKIFFDINNCDPEEAQIAIISAPLEKTTSYQKGTSLAPERILEASFQLEDFDIETQSSPFHDGIHNIPSIEFDGLDMKDSIQKIEKIVSNQTKKSVFPLILGGEHSVSIGVFKGIQSVHNDIGVLHFDAHGDFRDEYENEPLSHACVMRRIRDFTTETLSVGIRSICSEESKYIEKNNPNIIFAHEFVDFEKAFLKYRTFLKKMPERIYITFDVDVFDPSVISHTGTPEPGGLLWYQILSMLKYVFEEKQVVGADVLELMPREDSKVSDFTIAKLVGKLIAYKKYFS